MPEPTAGRGPPEWEHRQLAFLRVRLLVADRRRRRPWEIAEKVRAFGGRIEESGPTGSSPSSASSPSTTPRAMRRWRPSRSARRRAPHAPGPRDAVFAIHCADHLVGRRRDPASGWTARRPRGPLELWWRVDPRAPSSSRRRWPVPGAPLRARAPRDARDAWLVLRLEDGPLAATRFVGRSPSSRPSTPARSPSRGRARSSGSSGRRASASRASCARPPALQGWRVLLRWRRPVRRRRPTPRSSSSSRASAASRTRTARPGARARRAIVAGRRRRRGSCRPCSICSASCRRTIRSARSIRRSAASGRATPSGSSSWPRAPAQPLCLVVEDLHWIDAETQAVLDSLVNSLPTARLLLLVNYRPEYQHAWGSKTYYSQLRLDALPPESAGELLDAPPGRRSRAGAAQAASRRPRQPLLHRGEHPDAGGDERARGRARRVSSDPADPGDRGPGDRAGDPGGAHRPAGARGQAPAPDGLGHRQGRAASRCSRPSRRRPEEAVHRGLDALQAAEFLYETRLFPDPGTPSSMRSPMKSPTAPCSRTGARPCTPASSAPSTLLSGPADRARRAAGPPCRAGRDVGAGGHVPPSGRRQGLGAIGQPGGRDLLRAGADGPRASAREPRDAGAGHRSSLRSSNCALSARRIRADLRLSPRSRRPGAGRSTINGDSGSCPSICATTSGSPVIRRKRSRSARAPRLLPSRLGMFRSR